MIWVIVLDTKGIVGYDRTMSTSSLVKYLELDSTPIENTFYQGGPSAYEEDKTLATEYGYQYIELSMHLSNLLSSVSNTTDSMTKYKKFFTRKFGKHWCCSNPREGTKKWSIPGTF